MIAKFKLNAAATAALVFSAVAFGSVPIAQPTATLASKTSSQSTMSGGMNMKAMMKENNEKMTSMQMTGDQDVDFAMMMKMHHQGAIEMAEQELKMGKEPQMKKMAKDIIAAQKKEIAQFDKFLAKHKK